MGKSGQDTRDRVHRNRRPNRMLYRTPFEST